MFKRKKYIISKKIICFLIIFFLIKINVIAYAVEEDDNLQIEEINSLVKEVTTDIKKTPNINSRHAVVYDRNTGMVLFGKKENERCKMASTTKIMTRHFST